MNRSDLFTAIRPAFGGQLSAPQVLGIEVLLDEAAASGVTSAHHVAEILAQVRKETGDHMSPIKETVMPFHKNKNPSDEEVIRRLDQAWAKGQLPWVKAPYWRDGAFGRGPVQITHWDNYGRLGRAIGVNLRANPSLALDPKIGAKIAVIGMRDGLFRKHKLADYTFPDCLTAKPPNHPRRIINGEDGTDATVSRYHRQFHAALTAAGME